MARRDQLLGGRSRRPDQDRCLSVPAPLSARQNNVDVHDETPVVESDDPKLTVCRRTAQQEPGDHPRREGNRNVAHHRRGAPERAGCSLRDRSPDRRSIEDGDHGCSLAGGYALFWSPVYEPPDLCRYQPHLPEAIEDSPELWPRHKAHGSIRVQEGQPTAGFGYAFKLGSPPAGRRPRAS